VRALGINAYVAPQAGDQLIEKHDETGSGAGGHAELYVTLSGAVLSARSDTRTRWPLPRRPVREAPGLPACARGLAEAATVTPWLPVR